MLELWHVNLRIAACIAAYWLFPRAKREPGHGDKATLRCKVTAITTIAKVLGNIPKIIIFRPVYLVSYGRWGYLSWSPTVCSCMVLKGSFSKWTNAPDNVLILIGRINRMVTWPTVSCKEMVCWLQLLEKLLTWIERPCEGNALLPIFKETRHIRNITGPSSCSIYRVGTCPRSPTTLYSHTENKKCIPQ